MRGGGRQHAEDGGLAGLDGDAGEEKRRAQGEQDVFHEIVLARGDAPGEQEHVCVARCGDGGVQGFARVCGGGKDARRAAVAFH